ncbi:serine/threonine-protein kinase [Nonomuraea salmonea]|uniref:Serine/threonine-protein kinase n=1 Tax=Nonomuraea salmonea TaxID=46181 RepID=A0ABV5NHX2_9ACTN
MTVHRAPDHLWVGDHRVLDRLGEGGQGTVYLAESPAGAQVAIKVLHASLAADPQTRRRFLREAEVAGRVAAFCTAKVLGTGLVDERPYIVSEYVPGPSLDELVKRDGPRTGSGLERLAVATLTALASIHAAGIVHRDVKPGNVILGPEGPVLIDFGIARALDHRTGGGVTSGTPSYMSPEQFTEQPLTPASDMFSWAGTMVYAATGHPAFPASSVPGVLHAVLHGEPDLSGVPEPLRSLVAACLAKDPAARPSAQLALRRLTGGAQGPEATLIEPVRRLSGRWAAGVAVAVALLVTAGVLAGPSLWGRKTVRPGPSLDLAAYERVAVADAFTGDTSRRYAAYRPFPDDEELPRTTAGGGRFAGTGSAPYFGLLAGPAALASDQAVVAVTFGAFAATGRPEDSVFTGWIKDADDYVTAWYNNTRGTTGFDVRVGGEFRTDVPVQIPHRFSPGDRLALVLSGATITSYAEHQGTWQRLHTAPIAGLLTTDQDRRAYRYGFGLRGTTGTIAITRLEGRSVTG